MAVKTNHPNQMEFFAVPSPCIGVCQSGPKGYCVGCYRSRDERLYWLKVDDAAKRTIIRACQRRKQAALRQRSSTEDDETKQGPQQQVLFPDQRDS
ncbi:DUF1289 domain-containing protein [Alteromonas sp. C1M14]|uniref:DUF1289 domain-containing protein n=1 Tax=Alteromonas sp. C1M14 TaxID=2841567 RepID=UPI001C09128A|nr:DUF1289 domain-containing protein [Alteromonas sp. C1M14]MBU2979385.1 DUF1289 domain-containing protein [Alteromonas sp. C1M14]